MSGQDDTIVIIGAGLAGAATAYFLAKEGVGDRVVVLETEPMPGLHAHFEGLPAVQYRAKQK